MKDSGIEWIGKVPAHWEVKRIKHVAQLNPSKSELKAMPPDTLVTFLPMECIGETGQLDVRNSKPLSDVISGYTYLAENDVISAKITLVLKRQRRGSYRIVERHCICNDRGSSFSLYWDTQSVSLFFVFVFPVQKIAEGSMYGAAGQKRVSETFLQTTNVVFRQLKQNKRKSQTISTAKRNRSMPSSRNVRWRLGYSKNAEPRLSRRQ